MKIAIIGGGASGLACAVALKRRALQSGVSVQVRIFEQNTRVGKKLLATGNGRCNMLNTDSEPFYFSERDFHRYAIERYDAGSCLDFFARLGLYTRTDEQGRVYPLSNQASTVLDCLRNECERLGVELSVEDRVTELKKSSGKYRVNGCGDFDALVLACGGKAAVKDYNGYGLLRSLGHKITDVNPSLTKLNTRDKTVVKALQGIRHKVRLTLTRGAETVAEESGELLFTKYGLSGIAVMQLSAYIARKKGSYSVHCDLIPDISRELMAERIRKIIANNRELGCDNLLIGFMPKKLGEAVIKSAGLSPQAEIGSLKERQIKSICEKCKRLTFEIESLCSFAEAQVTSGGADTEYFSPETMESFLHKGLYCIGEMLNVDGLCGGYNLMWAWASGQLCAESIINETERQ